jgi:hypothetical protein
MNVGSAGTFVVYGNKTGKLTGLYTGDNTQTLIFNPDFAFKTGEILEVVLTGFLTATDGASLAPPLFTAFGPKHWPVPVSLPQVIQFRA